MRNIILIFLASIFLNSVISAQTYVWFPLGTGASNDILTLAVSGSDVYVGGKFTSIGGISANRIAKWNGSTWSALGDGLDNDVWAIAVSGSDIYAGGTFLNAGGSSANYIAKWNGSNWSALGSGTSAGVRALVVSGSDLFVGGEFITAGGVTVNNIARYNGGTWYAMSGGTGGSVYVITISGEDVYTGGFFNTGGGGIGNRIAKWNTSSGWSLFGTGLNDYVNTIFVSGSDVYVGGNFTEAGGSPANYIAKWNGSSWQNLGSGLNGMSRSILIYGSYLYTGGYFSTAGGSSATNIARWDGSSWSALGDGLNNTVWALAVNTTSARMMVGGEFTDGGGNTDGDKIVSFTDSDNPLPIELIKFTARFEDNQVILFWETATEINNFGFEIQRSRILSPNSYGEIWKTLGFVPGNGNSNSPKEYEFIDNNPNAGKLIYRLKQIDTDGSFEYYGRIAEIDLSATGVENPATKRLPTEYSLSQNYPNPFNPATIIKYTIPVADVDNKATKESAKVALKIFDLLGRDVAILVNRVQQPGFYEVNFDASDLTSGVYFYALQFNGHEIIKKMILLR